MTTPTPTTIRAEIEAEIANFAANASRGAAHLSFNHLPSILLRMLDMVEHYTGKGLEMAESEVAAVEKKFTTLSSDTGKVKTATSAALTKEVDKITAKVEANSAALEEIKEVVPALSEPDRSVAKPKKAKDSPSE